ncbi:hypothetical protein AAE478_008549 [Parahypoxylon ruwenzoriense]
MAGLRKKQSANLATTAPKSPSNSPGSKSDQGKSRGGVRLDAAFDNLSLHGSPSPPPAAAVYEPPHVRKGRGSPHFVQQLRGGTAQGDSSFQVGKVHDDGDVFAASPNKAHGTHPPASVSPAATVKAAIPTKQPVHALRSRASDLGTRSQVAGVDAQAFYPATACVFVANLPETVRDGRLEAEVTRAFSRFGIVFVKIRRDQRNMPFAFCQFTKNEDAHTAMIQGKGTLIEGRPCRTEMVKANRSFVVFDVCGRDVSVEDARTLMASFGPLNKSEVLHPQIQEAMGVQGGVLVEFTTFDPTRDVIAAYRHHPHYRVMAYDLKKATQPKVDPDEAWLQRYEVDRRSIFVGNLPVDVPDIEDLLKELAGDIGDVENVQFVQKESRTGRGGVIAFAFIEFSRPDMAELAVKRLSGQAFQGVTLRVERKASRDTQSVSRGTPSRMVFNDVQGPGSYKQQYIQNSPAGEMGAGPMTPLRANTAEPLLPPMSTTGGDGTDAPGSSTPAQGQPYHGYAPYGGRNFASPAFATSPYSGGPFPATPQGTPGVMSPYGAAPYYGTPYTWMTPYIQDTNFAAMAYYTPFPPTSTTRTSGAPSDGGAKTPTRTSTGKDEPAGSEGHQDAQLALNLE